MGLGSEPGFRRAVPNLLGKQFEGNGIVRTHDHSPLDAVFQFTDIAGPGIGQQRIQHSRAARS